MEDTGDYLVSSLRSSEGWGFREGSPGGHPHDNRHKATSSVSFQNALHDLQKEREGFVEEDEECDGEENLSAPPSPDSGLQDHPDPPAVNDSVSSGATAKKSVQEQLSLHLTTGSVPHPPNAPSPRITRRKSRPRPSDSSNAPKKTPSQAASTHLKPKLNPSFRETAIGGDAPTDINPLPKLRRIPKSLPVREDFGTKPAGGVSASPVASPKLLRRKSLGIAAKSPSFARRRFSVHDEPVGLSPDLQTRRLHQAGPANHASLPSPRSTGPSNQSSLRRYSSVNLPPIAAGPTRRRHSSVIPALVSPTESARHTGPASSSILAQTFGGQGAGGAFSVVRQRRVSQAVDELLHIEEVRRASEMRALAASIQPGEGRTRRVSQSHDLGDMLQGLKECRYLRGSTNEEEFV